MKNKYNEFNDGYSQGMFVMARNLKLLIECLEEEGDQITSHEIIEQIKDDINSSLYTHIATGGHFASESGYEVFLKNNTIVNDRVKALVKKELMENK